MELRWWFNCGWESEESARIIKFEDKLMVGRVCSEILYHFMTIWVVKREWWCEKVLLWLCSFWTIKLRRPAYSIHWSWFPEHKKLTLRGEIFFYFVFTCFKSFSTLPCYGWDTFFTSWQSTSRLGWMPAFKHFADSAEVKRRRSAALKGKRNI